MRFPRFLFFTAYFLYGVLLYAQPAQSPGSLLKKVSEMPDTMAARLLFEEANLYYLKGMNDSGVYFFSESLKRYERTGDHRKVADTKLALAKCKIHLQQFDGAQEILFDCLRSGEQHKMPAVQAMAKVLISFVFNYQGKPKEALGYCRESDSLFSVLKDTAGLLFLYPIFITSLGMNADTVTAMRYFTKGMVLFDEYEKSSLLPEADRDHIPLKRMALIFNSVNLMTDKDYLEQALRETDKVKQKIETRGNTFEQFELSTLTAVIYLKLKQFKKAQLFAEQAVGMIRPESGNHSQLADVYHIISDASDSLGEYQKAYGAMVLFKQYHDSVFNASSLEAIHTVEARYETEKKEQQIHVLNREKKVQKRLIVISSIGLLGLLLLLIFVLRAKSLQRKLLIKEKESQMIELDQKMNELEQTALRAQMNPHFIFNCLNSVQRYVIQHDIEGVNRYLSVFAGLIRQTLENSGKKYVTLRDELSYLETYIRVEQMRSGEFFDYDIRVDADIDAAGIQIPNMLVQPFVENCIRHGLQPDRELRATLKIDVTMGEKLFLIVEDNGPGVKSRMGNGGEGNAGHRSMGSSLTEKRIELYNKLHIDKISISVIDKSEEHKGETGTKVRLEFPVQ
jgi:tetratricopeptide (TPR) repeat protein